MAVNFPSGIENETFFRTVTMINFVIKERYLADERDI